MLTCFGRLFVLVEVGNEVVLIGWAILADVRGTSFGWTGRLGRTSVPLRGGCISGDSQGCVDWAGHLGKRPWHLTLRTGVLADVLVT